MQGSAEDGDGVILGGDIVEGFGAAVVVVNIYIYIYIYCYTVFW